MKLSRLSTVEVLNGSLIYPVPLSGMSEQMIPSMKRCLKKLLGQSRVYYELAKIQTVINNRPLTFLYDKPVEEVLTPNHLLSSQINLDQYLKKYQFQQ